MAEFEPTFDDYGTREDNRPRFEHDSLIDLAPATVILVAGGFAVWHAGNNMLHFQAQADARDQAGALREQAEVLDEARTILDGGDGSTNDTQEYQALEDRATELRAEATHIADNAPHGFGAIAESGIIAGGVATVAGLTYASVLATKQVRMFFFARKVAALEVKESATQTTHTDA